ncbi:MAG: transmembrane 220 family protein [Saprospiraceae bacterium]|nr:transmembrane 220 family protein [Saprospiraceae bacterium]
MKITYWVLSLVFVLFAAVQYNDPDPVQWILLYSGPAVFYGMAALGRQYRPAIWLWLAVSAGWALTYVPDFWHWLQMGTPSIVETMKAEKPYVELTREFLGLCIAAAGCGWLLKRRALEG